LYNSNMTQHKFRTYRFKPYSLELEHRPMLQTSNLNTQLNIVDDCTNISLSDLHSQQNATISSISPWKPSPCLRSLHTRFQNTILSNKFVYHAPTVLNYSTPLNKMDLL